MLNKNNFTNFVTKNKFLNRNIIIIMNIMKKYTFFCGAIFLFLWGNSLLAQTQGNTYTGNIRVTTQAQVDTLSTTLASIDTIDGNLTIGYRDSLGSQSNITDLTPLSNIIHITGNLSIRQNGQLGNLNDLNNLQTIGGGFYVKNNHKLTSLGDFSSLTSIGTGETWVPSSYDKRNNVSIVIELNTNLSLCSTLEKFLDGGTYAVTGDIYISSNATGCNSNDIDQPINPVYTGNIRVTTQAQVDALSTTLASIDTIDGNLTIGYRDSLSQSNITDLTPLSNIIHITGNLSIRQNGQLGNLNDLNNLQTIGGGFYVKNNHKLTSLGDFSSLTSIGTGETWVPSLYDKRNNVSIVIELNTNLSLCSTLEKFLDGGTYAVTGEIYINNNATGCNSNNIAQPINPVYTGNIRVTTQAQVDALDDQGMPLYGNVHKIAGSVEIIEAWGTNDPITDISVFSNLDTITGNIIVKKLTVLNALSKEDPENPNHYIGLSALKHIGACFVIQSNQSLETLGIFNQLQSITTSLDVLFNPSLEKLGEFNHLQSIGVGFTVYSNSSLKKLGNFNALQSLKGYFFVSYNDVLTSLGNFDQLQSVFSLDFSHNSSLKNLEELNSLQYINYHFYVYHNGLTTLGNFNQLQTIGRDFRVYNEDSLTTLGNFNQLQTIGGSFKIAYNNALNNLGDFSELDSIIGDFGVYNNSALLSIDVFPNLTSIGTNDLVFVPSAYYYKNNVSILVENNANLSLCSTLDKFLVGGTHAVEGDVYINNNAADPECTNYQPINVVYTGNIRVTTQAEVDALDDQGMPLYGNIHKIVGSVEIIEASETNDPITDISVFSHVDTITGNVFVQNLTALDALSKENPENPNNYIGLGALKHIGECFLVRDNHFLKKLGIFNDLQTINTSFDVLHNADLKSLGDFNQLQEISGDFEIYNNHSLTTLGNFNQLQSIGKDFWNNR